MSDPKYMLVMPADIAADVTTFISTEETRYYLNGFEVRMHGKAGWWAAATDGHRLGAFKLGKDIMAWPEHGPKVLVSWIIKLPPAILKACRAKPRHLPRYWLRVYEGGKGCDVVPGPAELQEGTPDTSVVNIDRSSTLVEASTLADVTIDGTFPDWERVIPRGELKPAAAAFNAKYLADFGKLDRNNRHGGIISIWTVDDIAPPSAEATPTTENAVLIQVSGRDDFIGVLMPMRTQQKPDPRLLLFGKKWTPTVWAPEDETKPTAEPQAAE